MSLPHSEPGAYDQIAFQILHRCGAAVIEARRFLLSHAAFVVQAFKCPEASFSAYASFCAAAGTTAERDEMNFVQVGDIRLGIGWADCQLATDAEMALSIG